MYSKLNSIIIPNKVEKIDEYAFMRSQICYAVIPDSVQRIATGAFEDCPYLKDIYIENASIVFDANIFNKWPSYVNQLDLIIRKTHHGHSTSQFTLPKARLLKNT